MMLISLFELLILTYMYSINTNMKVIMKCCWEFLHDNVWYILALILLRINYIYYMDIVFQLYQMGKQCRNPRVYSKSFVNIYR